MPTPSTLALFTAAVLAFLVVPGPAVLYIVSGQGSSRVRDEPWPDVHDFDVTAHSHTRTW